MKFKNLEDKIMGTEDYLELWEYLEEKGYNFKQFITQLASWLLAFVAAILGFTIERLITTEPLSIIIPKWIFITMLSLVGISISLYCLYLIAHFGNTIKRYFSSADKVKKKIKPLEEIIESVTIDDIPPICKYLKGISYAFIIAFSLVAIVSIILKLTGSQLG